METAEKKNVGAAEFVRTAWEISKINGTAQDLAKKLGYENVGSVHSRLATLKKKKVNLPSFEEKRGARGLDIDALNKIAEEASKGVESDAK